MSEFKQRCGTRLDVYEGIAHHTKGGLTRDDLIYCQKTKKVKSKKAVARGHSLINSLRAPKIAEPTPEPIPEPMPEVSVLPKKQKKLKKDIQVVNDKLPE